MAAKPPKAFDVWFVAANTVYKGVPYSVVADWVQEGRLAASDMVRPAGTKENWSAVKDQELLADFLPRPSPATAVAKPAFEVVETADAGAPATPDKPVELPDPEPGPRRGDEDDDVDMIPLIDISMVLLVFFIMIQATGALPPVEVPEMTYAGQLTNDPDAITVTIEKSPDDKPVYSVRVGNTLRVEKLDKPEAAVREVEAALKDMTRPPEVRIAQHRDLQRRYVYELRRDLEELRKKRLINSIVATVVETPQK